MNPLENRIEGIQAITYVTDNLDESARFFADWGLRLKAETSLENPTWLTANDSEVRLRSLTDTSVVSEPRLEKNSTLYAIEWAVNSQTQLDHLFNLYAAQHQALPGFLAKRDSEGKIVSVQLPDPHGVLLEFSLNRKKTLAVQGSPTNPWGHKPARIDHASPIYERAEPIEIGHVVLFTTQLEHAEAFYKSLGFVVSDRYPGRGVFLRCSARGGHHDIFLLQVPGKAQGLNHIAFTVRDIHEVFGGGLFMDRAGWKTQLGPGRHPISSAYFWYFECPCGGLIEYNADEDYLTEQWTAREFSPGPSVFAEWAIDGGIDGSARRQKTGPAAPANGKFLTERR